MQRNPRAAGRRAPWRRALRVVLLAAAAFVLGSVALVALLRFVPPPSSAFMLARALEARLAGQHDFAIDYQWQPLEKLPPQLALAVVAAEDQKFPSHHGFDLDSIGAAWRARADGGRVRGASTLSQQVAKNLFLWSGRSWLRKGLEAWFTLLIETLWPKARIIEVYLNVAEFGDGVYGAPAAARRYFHRPALALGRGEAARLAAVLPNPRVLRVDRPSRYVWTRVRWIERQMAQLGDAYLEPILGKR
jgi:monofunctional biosynthetic peptidoglycan transglycosylase